MILGWRIALACRATRFHVNRLHQRTFPEDGAGENLELDSVSTRQARNMLSGRFPHVGTRPTSFPGRRAGLYEWLAPGSHILPPRPDTGVVSVEPADSAVRVERVMPAGARYGGSHGVSEKVRVTLAGISSHAASVTVKVTVNRTAPPTPVLVATMGSAGPA